VAGASQLSILTDEVSRVVELHDDDVEPVNQWHTSEHPFSDTENLSAYADQLKRCASIQRSLLVS